MTANKILTAADAYHIYENIPEHMAESVIAYIETGRPMGSFLELIICNDFVHAAAHADEQNQQCLLGYCRILYMQFPAGSWGSKELMNEWMAARREIHAVGRP
jgi:hypothetical protein